jgi:hypothetical protein
MCPPAHCDPGDPEQTHHDPSVVDLSAVREAVTMYHGRALGLECLAGYLDEN